jgi:hypothetical protein
VRCGFPGCAGPCSDPRGSSFVNAMSRELDRATSLVPIRPRMGSLAPLLTCPNAQDIARPNGMDAILDPDAWRFDHQEWTLWAPGVVAGLRRCAGVAGSSGRPSVSTVAGSRLMHLHRAGAVSRLLKILSTRAHTMTSSTRSQFSTLERLAAAPGEVDRLTRLPRARRPSAADRFWSWATAPHHCLRPRDRAF